LERKCEAAHAMTAMMKVEWRGSARKCPLARVESTEEVERKGSKAMSQVEIIGEIIEERDRQEQLRQSGKFLWTCSSPNIDNARRLAVLAEEFGEVSREVVEEIIASDKSNAALLDMVGRIHDEEKRDARYRLRLELVQVAAVAMAWIEGLDAAADEERS